MENKQTVKNKKEILYFLQHAGRGKELTFADITRGAFGRTDAYSMHRTSRLLKALMDSGAVTRHGSDSAYLYSYTVTPVASAAPQSIFSFVKKTYRVGGKELSAPAWRELKGKTKLARKDRWELLVKYLGNKEGTALSATAIAEELQYKGGKAISNVRKDLASMVGRKILHAQPVDDKGIRNIYTVMKSDLNGTKIKARRKHRRGHYRRATQVAREMTPSPSAVRISEPIDQKSDLQMVNRVLEFARGRGLDTPIREFLRSII